MVHLPDLKKIAVCLSLASIMMLSACANNPVQQSFAPATEIVTKTVTVPMHTPQSIQASFGYGSNPAVIAAYEHYQQTGKALHISTDGFEGFPYDQNQQIYIACEPLYICTILFQKGELIKDSSIGDSANWDIKPMFVGGTGPDNAELLVIKPKAANVATNLVLTTNKRIYNIALLSSTKDYVRQAVFYYPSDTSNAIAEAAQSALKQQKEENHAVVANLNSTNINLNNINFNYRLSGDNPSWKPLRVFDDGIHTIIQFPNSVNSTSLPVLFVLNHGQNQLVNFRKQTEDSGLVDYVVDQIFSQAVLVAGVGSNQTKVVITNQKLDHSWF